MRKQLDDGRRTAKFNAPSGNAADMKHQSGIALLCSSFVLAMPVFASVPAEQVRCTAEPRSSWLPEESIRRLFGAEKYASVKFKISRTNCYEFYAVAHSGEIVEAYYHPVTGKLVKEIRVQPDGEVRQPPVMPRGRVR